MLDDASTVRLYAGGDCASRAKLDQDLNRISALEKHSRARAALLPTFVAEGAAMSREGGGGALEHRAGAAIGLGSKNKILPILVIDRIRVKITGIMIK